MGRTTQTVIATAAIVLFSLLTGCSSSKETGASETDASVAGMRKSEEDFRPSDYDQPVDSFFHAEDLKRSLPNDTVDTLSETTPAEQIQGYRVQIYSSSSIDSANTHKGIAEKDFPTTMFYLVYDPPTYKVRGGNFQSRFDADRFTREIVQKGYEDGWVVPDRIFKDAKRAPLPPNDTPPAPAPPHN
jgi:SPOR domain